MKAFSFHLTGHRRGASPVYLTCIAPSPDAALLIGQAAFPGHLVTVSLPTPHLPCA
jgi:hypothetical protein